MEQRRLGPLSCLVLAAARADLDEPGAAEAVGEALPIAITKRPPQPEPEKQKLDKPGNRSQISAAGAERAFALIDQPYLPGAHAEGLPAARVRHPEVEEGDEEQAAKKPTAPRADDGLTAVERHGHRSEHEPQGRKRKKIVKTGGEAAPKRSRNRLRQLALGRHLGCFAADRLLFPWHVVALAVFFSFAEAEGILFRAPRIAAHTV